MSAWDRLRTWRPAAVFVLLLMHQASAQSPGLGESVELVDPNVFRVCADPHNLPFSNEQGEGIENKLAQLFAKKLNEPVSYTYFPQVIGFVRNTLNALRCDVIMGTPAGDPMVQTTNPYYRTTYALVYGAPPTSFTDPGISAAIDPILAQATAEVLVRGGTLIRWCRPAVVHGSDPMTDHLAFQ